MAVLWAYKPIFFFFFKKKIENVEEKRIYTSWIKNFDYAIE